MSKLPVSHQFLDLSDYGRGPARWLVSYLKYTRCTAIHLTTMFVICGLLACYSILEGYYVLAAVLLILKSILDAADGEIARAKGTPSYVGRFYDSIADILLNLLILSSIAYVVGQSWYLVILAFIGIQLQGTLYNYYYVILRSRHNGDTTSRIFEDEQPIAFPGESQKTVNITYKIYRILYKQFDKAIYLLDKQISISGRLPSWFMTMVSSLGLGSQLLYISILLAAGYIHFVVPFFIVLTLLIPTFIILRRSLS